MLDWNWKLHDPKKIERCGQNLPQQDEHIQRHTQLDPKSQAVI